MKFSGSDSKGIPYPNAELNFELCEFPERSKPVHDNRSFLIKNLETLNELSDRNLIQSFEKETANKIDIFYRQEDGKTAFVRFLKPISIYCSSKSRYLLFLYYCIQYCILQISSIYCFSDIFLTVSDVSLEIFYFYPVSSLNYFF